MKKIRILLILIYLIVCTKITSAQEPTWVKNIKGLSSTDNFVIDSKGDFYIAGSFEGEVNFDLKNGEKKLVSKMNEKGKKFTSDVFIAKYDSEGTIKWIQTFGSTGDDEVNDICIDLNDNIYISGKLEGIVDIDPSDNEQLIGNKKKAIFNVPLVFFAKYNTEGKFIFGQEAGEAFNTQENKDRNKIAIDKEENIYIGSSRFFNKYNKKGEIIFSKEAFVGPLDIAIDNDQNIYIVGDFAGKNFDIDFAQSKRQLINSEDLISGGKDAFIAKYSSSGSLVWVKTYGTSFSRTPSRESLNKVKIKNGFVYAVGQLQYKDSNRSSIPDVDLVATYTEVFLLKMNLNGQEIWKKQCRSGEFQALDFDLDNEGNIYVVGKYSSSFSVNEYEAKKTLPSAQNFDVFFAKHNAKGETQWVVSANGAGTDVANAVCISGDYVYVVGNFIKDLTFNNQRIESSTNEKGKNVGNIFLAKFKK